VKRVALAVIVSSVLSSSALARTGTGDPVEVFRDKAPDDIVALHGQLRLRSAAFFNLDLDRGPSPTTGETIFPDDDVVLGHDARVRLSPSIFLGDEVRLFLDTDVVNASFGVPAVNGPYQKTDALRASFGATLLDIRALGVEWMTPLGVFSVGRMPAHFALGIAANDGADLDDDGGDRADRVAFVAPVYGHLVAAALDLLPQQSLLGEYAATLGVMHWRAPWEVELYRDAGRAIVDYGAALSFGWESKDAPGLWSVIENDPTVVRRNTRFLLADVWLRVVWDRFRLEGEGWASDLVIENPSPFAGVEIREPIVGNPAAFALQGEMRILPKDTLLAQVEVGAASADPSPGFPVDSPTGFNGSRPGDVFGAQVDLKHGGDSRFDSGRMNKLHRIDLILWRTLLGGVSEAAYARGRVQGKPLEWLQLEGNLVYSHALSVDSAPGGVAPLGLELDVAAEAWLSDASLRVDAGTLAPLGGMAARGEGPAGLAHMILVRLGYAL
jgi:hypothetical protein